MYCSTACQMAQPLGARTRRPGRGRPCGTGPARPSLRWSRFRPPPASSGTAAAPPSSPRPCRRRAAASRCGGRRASSAATFISLKCLSLPVLGTCGPRQRSSKPPSAYRDTSSPAGMLPMISALYFSPMDKCCHRIVARQHAARDRFVLGGKLGHALLDRDQVLRREGPLVGEVVVEAVLDHRSDGDLGVGKELLDRVGQQVRRRVRITSRPSGSLAVRIARLASFSIGSRCRRPCRRPCRPAPPWRGRHRWRRPPRRPSRELRKLALGAVGKRDVDHGCGTAKKKARGQPRFFSWGMQLWTRDYPAASGPWFLPEEFAVS